MFTAAYLLSSTGIRYKQNGRHEITWLQNVKAAKGGLKPNIIKERADKVFQLLPDRMKNLVIVNGNLSDFEMIQACVEVAEKYAENIIVIPPLLARMTYALEEVAKLHNPPDGEIILVVTVTHAFVDFVILQRNRDFELVITHKYMYKHTSACMAEFPGIYDFHFPDATILLVHDEFIRLADNLYAEFKPKNFFMRHYKRWDYLLMFGGLSRAPDVESDFDPRYHIPNFTMGIDTIIPGRGIQSNTVILPERTRIPCNIYGIEGPQQPITLFYFPEHYLFYDNLTLEKKDASTKCIWSTGSADQVIGFYDERGVPYITSTINNKNENCNNESEKTNIVQRPIQQPTNASSPSTSSSATTRTATAQITFVFEEQDFGIEIFKNGVKKRIKDSAGHEWTPMYLSMADGTPVIGEKAKNDYQRFPERVIYDVLKIIGKPVKEIQIDPKWGFKLIEDNGVVYFQVETPSGPRRIPQEIVISAFLKAMKLSAEAFLDTQIKEIRLSTTFRLSQSQKSILEKAASEKNNLRILYFIVTDV